MERLALGGSSQGGVYEAVRATATAPDGRQAELWGSDQWDLFAEMVRERDPRRIAVNISHDHNFADGLSAGEWEQMAAALGADLASRVVREPLLAIEYLAMRVPAMTPVYRRVQAVVHEIIGTAFSEVVIVPGRTTTADVVWWMRQRVHDLGLDSWFQPSVSVQRRGADMSGVTAPVIERGDVLHCDFGLVAFGLATDTQHMAYVLREGETEAPAGLRQALANSNRLQDILLEETKVGRTGNEILAFGAGEDEGGGAQRDDVHAPDRRPRPRRRSADRPVGLPDRRPRPRRSPGDPRACGSRPNSRSRPRSPSGTASPSAWLRKRKRRSRSTARSAGCSAGRPNCT